MLFGFTDHAILCYIQHIVRTISSFSIRIILFFITLIIMSILYYTTRAYYNINVEYIVDTISNVITRNIYIVQHIISIEDYIILTICIIRCDFILRCVADATTYFTIRILQHDIVLNTS